jgi:hypothetical protein
MLAVLVVLGEVRHMVLMEVMETPHQLAPHKEIEVVIIPVFLLMVDVAAAVRVEQVAIILQTQ